MNYMQYGNTSRPTYQTSGWNNRIRPVSSIDEVRAAPIDFDGSIFYFSDLANKKIYTKQINCDGTAQINMYELKSLPPQDPKGIDTSMFITRGEFEEVITQFKNYLTTLGSETREATTADAPVSKEPEKISFNF